MQISGEIDLRLSVKPAVTQEMVQSLNVLRMPVLELARYIGDAILENPVLDVEALTETGEPPEYPEPPGERDDAWDDADFGEASYLDIWRVRPTREDSVWDAGTEQADFSEMLAEQVRTGGGNDSFNALCLYLIGCLNQSGYLDVPVEELAHETNCSVFDVTQALYFVQSLYPPGVGARNLSECLLLQLAESHEFCEHTVRLATAGLSLLAERDTTGVAKLLRCDETAAARCMKVVAGLNPIPSQGYYTGERAAAIIPDVIVRGEAGELSVAMNERYVPRIRFQTPCDPSQTDRETQRYLFRKTKEARLLQSSVEERTKTLTLIVQAILRKQHSYFRHGGALEPMTQSEIGEMVGLHASTVSRAVRGKYIEFPSGVVALKSLFCGSVPHTVSGAVSSDAVTRQLRRIIEREDSRRPLSDESLCAALRAAGVGVARRTVAKYRAELGIPAASGRKKG